MTNEPNSASGAQDMPLTGSEISLGRDIDGPAAELQATDSVVMSDMPNPTDTKPSIDAPNPTNAEPSSELPAPQKIVWIPVQDIQVVGERRAIQPAKVQRIRSSMKLLGHQTPITVRLVDANKVLVAGLHRLEAVKALGWTHIRAVIYDGDETDAADWEDDENFARAELTVLEWAERLDRRRRRVASVGVQVAPPGGQQPRDAGINKTADVLGVTREEIRRAKRIAGLSLEAKSAVKQHGFDDNQSALLEIAHQCTPKAQVAMVLEIAGRKEKSSAKRSARSGKAALALAEAQVNIASSPASAPPTEEVEHDEAPDPAIPEVEKRDDTNAHSVQPEQRITLDEAPPAAPGMGGPGETEMPCGVPPDPTSGEEKSDGTHADSAGNSTAAAEMMNLVEHIPAHDAENARSADQDQHQEEPVEVPETQPKQDAAEAGCAKAKTKRPLSRPQRWAYAAQLAREALQDLLALQAEYQEWREEVLENLQDSTLVDQIQAICELDLQGALETVEEAESTDLPRGFVWD